MKLFVSHLFEPNSFISKMAHSPDTQKRMSEAKDLYTIKLSWEMQFILIHNLLMIVGRRYGEHYTVTSAACLNSIKYS